MKIDLQKLVPINWIQWLTLALIPTIAIPTAILFHRQNMLSAHQNDALRTFLCIAIAKTPPEQRKPRLIHKLFVETHLKPCDKEPNEVISRGR